MDLYIAVQRLKMPWMLGRILTEELLYDDLSE
jgi:hypothetical protein